MTKLTFSLPTLCVLISSTVAAHQSHQVSDQVIDAQRAALAKSSVGKGFGPQAPRDIDQLNGTNPVTFTKAPASKEMNLCNIHFHKNAEHKGGEFTTFAGNGDGHGFQSGYKYDGKLSAAELKPVAGEICPSKHGNVNSGDTLEVHYVYTTAPVTPGPTLNSCFSEQVKNPELRVETQVLVAVNDNRALDFNFLLGYAKKNGLYQALNIPANTGTPVEYLGSTTGPSYNEISSPFQVTWSVRPKVAKVNANTIDNWCQGNDFKEDHAHGVRNLVINPQLISAIE